MIIRSKLFLVVFLVAALVIPACSAQEQVSPTPDSIQGINWQWVSVRLQPGGETTLIADPQNYTIIFNQDGTVTGKADCNNFFGKYSTENGLVISDLASSKMFCGEDSLDMQYLELLSNVVAGGPDGKGGLALENAGGEKRMEFTNGGSALR